MITNPIANIPINKRSHVYGWAKKWSDLLEEKIDHKCELDHEKTYIEHGANFSGTLNLFGGANEEVYKRIDKVILNSSCPDNVFSLDHDMPDYGAMLKKRIGAKTTCSKITEEWCNKVSERCNKINTIRMEDMTTPGITVGDSHTIAFAASGDAIFRNDGKTLYGALNAGLKSFMRGVEVDDRPVTFCFGSIDIRHHLCRHKKIDLRSMIERYIDQAYEVTRDPWFAVPVPVEYPNRKIPKSGFYKGEPFFGSWNERWDLTNLFIELLNEYRSNRVVSPPGKWYKMDPEKYAKEYMELSSSFHIAPPYYRSESWGQNEFIG